MDLGTIAYITLWLIVIVEGVALVVLTRTFGAMILGTRDAIERDGLKLGTVAPRFVATDTEGVQASSSGLFVGWTVAIFASASCRICREMLPALADLSEKLADQARVVILLRGSPEEARTLPVAGRVEVFAIGAHGIAEQYRVRVSPYVNIIDPAQVVRAKGLADASEHIEHLLREAGFEHPVVMRHSAPSRRPSEVQA
jgi:hypothetical protein